MDIFLEINYLCRFCLRETKDAIDLFTEQMESKDILNKIYLCFQIRIKPNKCLPSIICRSCIRELRVAYSFRVKCETFENRFSIICDPNSKRNPINVSNAEINKDDESSTQPEVMEDICEIEEADIPDEINLNVMKSDHQGEYSTGDKFKCCICNKILKTKASLSKHNISMHQNRKHAGKVTGFGATRRYHCTKCSYSTPHSQTLVNHMRRHDGDRPYICECGKRFTQSSSLTAHRKTHSDITNYTCAVCGKQFKHEFSLKNHLRVHEIGNYSCELCHKILKSSQSLQSHMHRHYNIRNYNCEDCGDTFVTSSELLNHRKKHSTDKSFECHLCGYKTYTKKTLIIHLKRHTGEKSFKCELCVMTFYTRADLHRHGRVHTREKPFSCPTCSQRFTHSPSLNKHMSTVHGVQYKWGDFKWRDQKKIPCSFNLLPDKT